MPFKRRDEPGSVDEEREGLREQRRALDELKRQLTERVQSVQERERELQRAILEAGKGKGGKSTDVAPPVDAPTLIMAPAATSAPPEPDAVTAAAVAEAEAATARAARAELDVERRARELEAREAALAAREQAVADRENAASPVPAADPDAVRLAKIEERLGELREAEKLFLRTRDELAERSEAVSLRERLVGQRERELEDKGDTGSGWGKPELSELEQRLRKLEQQQPGEQAQGFSGGFKKLQQQGTRPRREG